MADWPIGLSTGCFYKSSLFDVLDLIRDHAVSVLEICSSRHHLDYHDFETVRRAAREISKRGLEAFSFHAPFGGQIDISAISDEHRQGSLQDVLVAVQAAAEIGARYFVLHPGPEESRRPPAEEYLQRLSRASDSLERVADQCREKGMLLALENMLPHLLFGPMPDLFWMLGAVKAPNVGICLDTGHAFLAQALYSEIEQFSAHLRMVHAADNHGHYDDHLPPGKDDIDWARVIAALAGINFTGPIILELSGESGDNPGARLREAVAARQYLRELCRQHVTKS
jgi:sugar phosphate isomerase/epimerase